VFAALYPQDRRADMLVVIDVSGSMARPAPGANVPLIDLVVDGCNRLGQVLPDDARLSLWAFGSRLDPPRDYSVLLPPAPLTNEHRGALTQVTQNLKAKADGHWSVRHAARRVSRRPGRPPPRRRQPRVAVHRRSQRVRPGLDHGRAAVGEAGSREGQGPAGAADVVTYGPEPEANVLSEALKPVDGYVDPLTTADELRAVFIHVAAGGLHG
jgi:hypothetical protein